jgi:single-strand DNA-binding protein
MKDAEPKYTQQGQFLFEVDIAVNHPFKKKSSSDQYTISEYVRVTMWGERAEKIVNYIKKGSEIAIVTDWLEANAWIDKKTGEARSQIQITARDLYFIGARPYSDSLPSSGRQPLDE